MLERMRLNPREHTPHFLEADHIRCELGDAAMDGADLPIFFGAGSVWAPAGEPLDIPEGDGDGGRGSGRLWRCIPLREEKAGDEGERDKPEKKSASHRRRLAVTETEAKQKRGEKSYPR